MYYGTYGKSVFLNLPYRTDKGGGNSDFITVGKVDNGRAGIFSEDKGLSYSEMVWRWVRMDDGEKTHWLNDIFLKERQILPALIEDWRKHHPGKQPVFEIGNEPNLFPYIPPRIYAWYFQLWKQAIDTLAPNAEIMNGGIFCTSLLPKKIRKKLKLIGVGYEDEYDWWCAFADKTGVLPNIKNLHIYPVTRKPAEVYLALCGLKIAYGKRIWVTEYGNLNPFDMAGTVEFVKELSWAIQRDVRGIERMYYFQAAYSERHFQIFHEIRRRFSDEPWFERITEISKFLFRKKDSWLRMILDYVENPPIQNLEDEAGLNDVGRLFTGGKGD